jgi:RNA polymerase sigma factor (sigma-70 family)
MSRSPYQAVNLALLQGREGSVDERDTEWLQVFRHYQPRLRSFFAWRAIDQDDLEDILAEIWARAVLFVGSLRSSGALWNWLTTIGNNVIRDKHRRLSRHPEITATTIGSGPLESFILGWSFDAYRSQEADELNASGLNRLSAPDREYLELFAVDGLSHGELAIRLGLASAAASRQRLRRIRLRFLRSHESSE